MAERAEKQQDVQRNPAPSCASAGTCTSKKVDMHEPMNMYSSIKKSDRRCQWKGRCW